MKIRNGFVSNSSSASFIISADAYKSIFDLALKMIEIRDRDWSTWRDENEDVVLKNKIIEAKKKNATIDFISFPTTNYDTFIGRIGDYYAISTCNNHWNFFSLNGSLNKADFLEKIGFQDYEDFEIYFSQSHDFWFPLFDLFGRIVNWEEGSKIRKSVCQKKHYNDLIKEKDTGKVYCSDCLLEKSSGKD